jgi:AcrR family transcriptional regulator
VASGTRTRLAPAARREQLVRLGLEMFAGRPLDQVAVEEIAEAAGISRGLLFHYFPTKRDYLEAVVRAAADEMLGVTQTDASLPITEQLRQGLEAYIDYLAANRPAYVSLVRGALGADPRLAAVFDETRRAFVDRLLEGAGLTDPSPVLVVAVRGWVAMVEEATIEWLEHQAFDRAELVDLLEDAILHLVSRDGGSAGRSPTAPRR